MTMRYVEVASTDLQREFHLARSSPGIWRPSRKPRSPRLAPAWMVSSTPCCSLNTSSNVSSFATGRPSALRLDRLSNRLTKILSEARKLNPAG